MEEDMVIAQQKFRIQALEEREERAKMQLEEMAGMQTK